MLTLLVMFQIYSLIPLISSFALWKFVQQKGFWDSFSSLYSGNKNLRLSVSSFQGCPNSNVINLTFHRAFNPFRFISCLYFNALDDSAVIDPIIYIIFYIIYRMWIDQNRPETTRNQSKLTRNPPGINKNHARINQNKSRPVREEPYLAFTCRFKLHHICTRLFVLVVHLDNMIKIVANRKFCKDYILFTSLIFIKYVTNILLLVQTNHALQWMSTMDCSFPGQFLHDSDWYLVGSWSVLIGTWSVYVL